MTPPDSWQRDFFQALALPLRGTSRLATDLNPVTEGHDPQFFAIAEKWIKPSSSLSGAERLELYHRQYWYRLLDSLAEDFPIVRKMAGEALFQDLMETYLLQRPSRSYTLRHLGEAFAEFLQHLPILDATQRTWLSAIATIEYAHMESFEALQCALPQPDDLENKKICVQDHVRMLRLSVPADLCRDWEDLSPACRTPHEMVCVVVWRHASGRSEWMRIPAAEYTFLLALRAGVFLGEFFEQLPEPHPEPSLISQWFTDWQSRGWLGVQGEQVRDTLDASIAWQSKDAMSSQAISMR